MLVASTASPKSGPFPPPALPGFPGTTNLSVTPRRPGLSLAGVRLGTPSSHRWGFPCCLLIPLPLMPSPVPRRDRSSHVARLLDQRRPSPSVRWVGSRIARFEVCSAFTHVLACLLADSPKEPFPRVLQSQSLPPRTAPGATGWSDQLPGGVCTR